MDIPIYFLSCDHLDCVIDGNTVEYGLKLWSLLVILIPTCGHCFSTQNMYQSDALYHQTCINLTRFITDSLHDNSCNNMDPERVIESVPGKVSLFNCCSFQIRKKKSYWFDRLNLGG